MTPSNHDLTIPYHYECVMSTNINTSEATKQKAYEAMRQLEGWCSFAKAAVLIDLILIKNPQVIVEIGVFGGKSLIPMAIALKELNKGIAFGIDPWSVSASVEGMDNENYSWWSQINHDAFFEYLAAKIDQFGLQDQIQLIRQTSEQADLIYNIDLLHLDGNHSEKCACLDVEKWVPLVTRGGIIAFDDTNWSTTQKAVEWLDTHCIRWVEFIENDHAWGLWIKP